MVQWFTPLFHISQVPGSLLSQDSTMFKILWLHHINAWTFLQHMGNAVVHRCKY